jgi:urocanate hydratase
MTRNIKAQRGGILRCKGWRQETILRMLENNLENAENPDGLVVYTGARAARDWEAYDLIFETLLGLRDDETLIIQSGKPIFKCRTHDRAPRVLMANGNVLGRWADDKNYYELQRRGLTFFPGMTAAAWQYIGSQGILQGTYQTFMGAAEQHFGGDLVGRSILTAGCGGMGGAQPLAGKLAGAAILCVDPNARHIRRRVDAGYCDRMTESVHEAVRWIEEAKASKTPVSVGLVGNAADVHPKLLAREFQPDIVTDQVNTDPYRGYIPIGMTPDEAFEAMRADPDRTAKRGIESLIRQARAMLEFRRRGAIAFEYGNDLRERVADAGLESALEIGSFITLFIRPYFCEGKGPFRWLAASGNPDDITYIDALVRRTFSDNLAINRWIALAREHVPTEGLPARIGWLGHGERSKLATLVNSAVANGELSGPIAFTRDHLDAGSVAYPLRETEAMPDGSDAISDWPILNALLACASGADLVAVHAHGNRWQSAGQTAVADGTVLADARLGGVLDGDTTMGIVRHAEAGIEKAVKMRDAHHLQLT